MNLFKKIFNQTQEGLVLKEVLVNKTRKQTNSYPKEVLEIHNEFLIAADKLLEEANSVLKQAASKNVSKVNRLQSLGFKQVREVEELKPLLHKAELSKEQVLLINGYKLTYPNNKFITEDQVKTICHKYNLVCGEVSRFKGFVPDKNLKEIEMFKLKQKEKNSFLIEYFDRSVSLGFAEAENIEIRGNHGVYHLHSVENLNNNEWSFQQSDVNLAKEGEFYGYDYENLFGLRDKGFLRIRFKNKSLLICAPVKDMDISGLELIEGYKLEKKYIPDPIVLQPVKGGYLILTMWADETFDPFTEPLLRNDTFNN